MDKKFKKKSKLWKEEKKYPKNSVILSSQIELYTREIYINSLYIK